MRNALIPIALLTLSLAVGCNNNPSTATTASTTASSDTSGSTTGSTTGTLSGASGSASLTPEQLGALGAQIKKDPNNADALLSQHGLNAQSFAAAIRKVSESPADSKRYAASYKSAS